MTSKCFVDCECLQLTLYVVTASENKYSNLIFQILNKVSFHISGTLNSSSSYKNSEKQFMAPTGFEPVLFTLLIQCFRAKIFVL